MNRLLSDSLDADLASPPGSAAVVSVRMGRHQACVTGGPHNFCRNTGLAQHTLMRRRSRLASAPSRQVVLGPQKPSIAA